MFADHHPGLLLQRAAPIAHNATEGDIGQTSDTVNALHGNASLYFRDCHYSDLSIVQRIACHVFCSVGCWSLLVVAGPDRYANPSPGKAWGGCLHIFIMDEDLAPEPAGAARHAGPS